MTGSTAGAQPPTTRWDAVAGAAGVTAAIGLVGMAGWVAGLPLLVQIRPTWAAMPVNTALALIAAGAALLLAHRGTGGAAALTLLMAGLAIATGVQDVTGVDLGIDRLLIEPWIATRTTNPGRMAPQTWTSLAAAAVALALVHRLPTVARLLGTVVLALGAVALAGYASGVRAAVTWGHDTDVPLLSALGFVVLGAGIIGAARPRRRDETLPAGTQYAAAAAVVLATVVYWQALARDHASSVRRSTRQAAVAIEHALTARVETQALELQDAAAAWTGPDARAWKDAARRLLRLPGGPAALEWIDRTPTVRARALPPGTRGLRAPLDDRQRVAVDEARAFQRLTVTPPVPLDDGRPAFRMLVPVVRGGAVVGFLAAVHPVGVFLDSVLEDLPGYDVALVAAGARVHDTRPDGAAAAESEPTRVVDLPGSARWEIVVQPTAALLAGLDSRLPEVLLVAGLVIALCLFAALRAWHHAAARVQELAQANRLLDGEIQAHQRELATRLGAEEQLRAVMHELDLAVQARTAELASVSGSLSTESALRRRAQETLARSVEDLRQFASFVSHELRQPLASMQIWVKLLGSTYGDVLDERGATYLAEIRDAIARMTGLVEAQLRLVHDTTSAGTIDTPVELALLLDDLIEKLEPQLLQIGATVETHDLPTVRGDASQLRQLFRNLIENAVKYRRPGTPLAVTVRGRALDGDGTCEIVVEDNGQGFAPELQDEIFCMFRRASAAPSPGAGVGLAICRRIVERHGGTIRAEGSPGVGARFVIVLPADRCETADATVGAPAPA